MKATARLEVLGKGVEMVTAVEVMVVVTVVKKVTMELERVAAVLEKGATNLGMSHEVAFQMVVIVDCEMMKIEEVEHLSAQTMG